MALRVYNSLTQKEEEFVPLEPGKVRMYVCGPNLYGPAHVGHAMSYVVFDTIKRYLAYNGYDVTLVINITDVDDKLIAESTRRGVSMAQVADEMTADYMANMQAMGVDGVDHYPKATEHIQNIIQFTADLVQKGFAYEADGDIYFDVRKVADYGKLSGRTLESMQGEGGGTAEEDRG